MATAALIDLSNYDTLLVQSSASRSGTPDGNIYFDVTNGRLELISYSEQALIDMTDVGGSASEDNPLTNALGIKFEALYAFENQERRTDETLRQYDRFTKATFKYGGAFELVNSRKFDDANGTATSSTTDDRVKIRASGWIERASDGGVDRIYYGVTSLGSIDSGSQPYYQLTDGGAPVNFAKAGDIDEAIQVYGDTGNTPTDANAGDFDTRTFLANKVRTYGNNYDAKTLDDSGISEMGGYFSGFALGESTHLTTNTTDHPLASVYNSDPTAQTGVWYNMYLEELDTAQTETGFNEGSGDFTWVLNNPSGADLEECVAYLDAIAQTDDDINAHSTNTTYGMRVDTWYSYDAQGRIVTQSGTGSGGVFLDNIPTADQQSVVFTADDETTRTYPFNVSVEVSVGAYAVADTLAWYHCFFYTDYGTASAVTVQDADAADVSGNVSTDASSNKITFSFDYDGDTLGGTAATDKDVVFVCEGDGGATQAKTVFTISRTTTITATCEPGLETNV